MNKFKTGDKIKRTGESSWPEQYGEVGEIYKVLSLSSFGNPIVISGANGADTDFFELVEPYVVPQEGVDTNAHGGPSSYYDFPFKGWVTLNDMAEYLAVNKWKEYSIHFKDVLKVSGRWGDKDGTTKEYDARKIVYSGLRILSMVKGKQAVVDYLRELSNDPQFKGEEYV